ncbi:glycosyltransferase family 39 protein [Nostoc sp. FACHB-110]|uniref:glycosyltransferase family 39 protein n=1 Tax=Nostoc sp. FACHB-110 TaxID=2692834 RepID=UPI0016885A33|nr:glycosyltransferase family 39 protein [Nostoc sp. FACHB-110]MBD2440308.1 glycosyltransferase family 39 protein [Nostoc sp. FACHB-110]
MQIIKKYQSNGKFVLHFFFLIVLLLGIFFRFTNLDHKVYWYDEAITSLRASGYTEQEVVEKFSPNSVVSVTELQRYQHPDGTRNLVDTAKSLIKEDPQHPPLYYSLANIWFRIVGSSPALARFLPALLSLIAFPCAYWLCQELFIETGVFTSTLPTYLMMGLIAVSPFHVLFAQESRQYSLWAVTTLLTTAALLRAIRLNSRASWGLYIFTLVISFYTFLLTGWVMIAHALYVMIICGFRNQKTIRSYFLASVLSIVVFLPYAWILIVNQSQANKGLSWASRYSLKNSELRDIWIQHLGRIFFDVNQAPWDFYVHRVLIVLTLYAFYRLCRQTPISVWLLIVLLTFASTLPLMIPDLISGGIRSTLARYMIPGLLAVQLAITYLLGKNLTSPSLKSWYEKFWRLFLVILVTGSILSCVVTSQATVWYNKGHNGENMAVAKIINQATHPLLISDASVGRLLSLSYSLNPTVKVLLQPRCATCPIQSADTFRIQMPVVEKLEQFSDVFLYRYNPSKDWLNELAKQQNYKFEPISIRFPQGLKERPVLWKVDSMKKAE